MGTLVANLLGSFLAGGRVAWLDGRTALEPLRLLRVISLIGGLTTISGLAIEVLVLARGPRPLVSAAYLGITRVAGLGLAALGARRACFYGASPSARARNRATPS
ncbi:hypothetical protein GCM10027188_00630 [Lysobacter humi (ex Lee et al. 2017)]